MKSTILLLFLLLFAAGYACGAEKISLKESVSMAFERNHLIKAAGYSATAMRQGVEVARSRYYPGIAFEESFVISNSPVQTFMMKLDEGRFTQEDFQVHNLNAPASRHDFKTTVTLQQPLYVPSLSPMLDMASKNARKSDLELEAVREGVAFQVFRLYLDLQKSAAQLNAAEMALADARENLRLASVRTAAGTGLRSDELRARTFYSQTEQQFVTARNNLALARLQLSLLIGLPEGHEINVSENITEVIVPALDETMLQFAHENKLDLKLSRNELEKAEAALRLAWSDYLPTLGASASYQMNGKEAPFSADNDSWNAGISLKWQLFDGFRRCRERDRATAERAAAQELLENRRKEIGYQLRESYLRHDETGKRLDSSRNAVLDAEETVRLLTRRFENSLATMAELLDAQTALNQARAGLAENMTNHALAAGRVYLAAGIFVKEVLK